MRKTTISLFIVLLTSLSFSCRNTAQKTSANGNSAESMLEKASELTAMSRPDSALTLLDSALQCNDIDDTIHAMAVAEKANNMLMLGRIADALPLCRQAIDEGRRIGNDEVLINQYSTCGIVYRRLNMPDSALWAYNKGIEVSKRMDMKDYVANLYNNIAVVYVETGRLGEGLGYADEAIKWARQAKDTVELFSAMATKASILLRQKKYEACIQTIAPHFQDITNTGSVPLTLKTAAPMLQACVQNGRADEAQRYIKALQPALNKAEPTSNGALGIFEIEAALAHARHEYKRELALWNRIDTLNQMNHGIPRDRILSAKAKCLQQLGLNAEAVQCLAQAYAIADSTKNSGINRQMSEFSVRYKTQQKELQIVNISREKATQRAHFMTLTLILAVTILTLAILLTVILYKRRLALQRYQLNLRRKYIEGLENERARLARELHDGVCNDLLGLQMTMATGNATTATPMLREILTGVRQISHDLMPPRFSHADVSQIVADYVANYPLPDCHITFACTPTAHWRQIDEAKAFEIYRITQELMGNIAKHSHAKNISVQMIYDTQDTIKLTVENDGAEMQLAPNDNGIGLYTTADRVQGMNGNIMRSKKNGRYCVVITINAK